MRGDKASLVAAKWGFLYFFYFPEEQINLLKHLAPCLRLPGLKKKTSPERRWDSTEDGPREKACRHRVGWGIGEQEPLLSSAGQTSGRPSGRLGDLTLREAVIWENSSAVCPGKLRKHCSSVVLLPLACLEDQLHLLSCSLGLCPPEECVPSHLPKHTHIPLPLGSIHKEWGDSQNITKRQVNEREWNEVTAIWYTTLLLQPNVSN